VNDRFRVCFRWTALGAEDVEIVAGKRAVTADTDLRLCRFFGLSNGYWLRAQAACDTEVAQASHAKTLAKIKPWTTVAANAGVSA
jgi:plasmid maintenance system antidote protein VapI